MNRTVIIRRKRKRIKGQIDNLQEESPFRTTEYGTSRQQVAKERTKMIFEGQKSVTRPFLKPNLFHFSKRRNSKKSLREITFHKNALFNWQQRKVFIVLKVSLVAWVVSHMN